VFVGVLLLAWISALVPIWAAPVLPLEGWYEQLALVQLWSHLGDARWAVERFYARALAPVPGWTQLGLIRALATVLPVETAGRAWLSVYALALPVGVARLADAFGRSRWLALFAFALVWNLPLAVGQASFAAGLALLAFAVAELELLLRRPSRGHAVAVVALGLLLWLTDAGAWGFFVLAAIVLCATTRPAALTLLLPSVALALVGARAMPSGDTPTTWPAMIQRLADAPSSMVLTFGDRAYELLLLLGGVWLILLLGARTDEADTQARGFRLEALTLLALLLALTLPADLHRPVELGGAAARFWPVVALLLALAPHGPLDGRRRLWLLPVLAIVILYPLGIRHAAMTLEKPLHGARRLAELVEPGASTLTVAAFDPEPLPFGPRVHVVSQAHAFPVLVAGGFDPALPVGFPLRRTGLLPTPPSLGALDPDAIASWDHLLTFGEGFPYERLGPDAQSRFPLDATDGKWRLYRRAARSGAVQP